MPDAEIDARTFWTAIGMRAVGAAVVTAGEGDNRAGFLALSATHLCASPPTLMVSASKSTSALAALKSAGAFAINYLDSAQTELAMIFGGRRDLNGAARFSEGNWGAGASTGAPVLHGGAGFLECRLVETIERFETEIVLGRLVGFDMPPDPTPLVSYSGRYLGLNSQ